LFRATLSNLGLSGPDDDDDDDEGTKTLRNVTNSFPADTAGKEKNIQIFSVYKLFKPRPLHLGTNSLN